MNCENDIILNILIYSIAAVPKMGPRVHNWCSKGFVMTGQGSSCFVIKNVMLISDSQAFLLWPIPWARSRGN